MPQQLLQLQHQQDQRNVLLKAASNRLDYVKHLGQLLQQESQALLSQQELALERCKDASDVRGGMKASEEANEDEEENSEEVEKHLAMDEEEE
jgi:hypothetical protein